MAEGKKFSPVATAYLDFIQTEKKRIIGTSFKWIKDKIEVVQNKYALFFCFGFVFNIISINNKSLSFQDCF
jgi:hypothetical protein